MASGNYLIDSDVLIDHLRGYAPARDFLSALLLDGATLYFFSVISEAEIYSNVRPGEEPRIHALFDAMSRLIVDGAVARRAGSYRDALRATTRLALPDALIAATAREHDATLVTRNVRHYTTPRMASSALMPPPSPAAKPAGLPPRRRGSGY